MITFVGYKTEDRFNELELKSEWIGSFEDLKADIEDIAQECAQQDWDDHDGWESKWPKTIFQYFMMVNCLVMLRLKWKWSQHLAQALLIKPKRPSASFLLPELFYETLKINVAH